MVGFISDQILAFVGTGTNPIYDDQCIFTLALENLSTKPLVKVSGHIVNANFQKYEFMVCLKNQTYIFNMPPTKDGQEKFETYDN